MNWFDSWALTLAVFIPAVGAVIVMLIPRAEEEAIKWVALLTTLATLRRHDRDRSPSSTTTRASALQFDVNKHWIDVINSRYHVAIDGISLPLLALSAFITVLCVIYSWNHFPEPHNPKAFLALILILEVGMNGTFIAQDLILFFVFFEIVLLPMFFMIGVWGGPNREYASIKFFLFTLFGSALMLLSFLALYFKVDVAPHVPGVAAQLRHGAALAGGRRGPRAQHAAPDLRAACSSASRSRCRCSRSTRGCPTRTPKRPRSVRCCWPRSC